MADPAAWPGQDQAITAMDDVTQQNAALVVQAAASALELQAAQLSSSIRVFPLGASGQCLLLT